VGLELAITSRNNYRFYLIIFIALLAGGFIIAFLISLGISEGNGIKEASNSSLIQVVSLNTEPSELKEGTNGTLILDIRNMGIEKKNLTIYFETSKNVKLYLGYKLLNRVGANYTYFMFLDPGEESKINFIISGTLDVGDAERTYYIKVYVYWENTPIATLKTTVKITR